ncbi:tape measure domain-containing protein [Paenisporosarcina sp. HGH0030]|uniref:tape measure protein n=1 Tax=Paenisporosarcina sp. HGH0030 TaxID=1078085 RepID=UPI00034E5D30|nr:tape measure protein [Paenisporosarcina sp. HGH0030]EPD52753.1 tape measure domain-containing protein [Paenisporosarcina sp. HGH0030]
MSGVQTSLALQDKLTGPLMKMMRAMDQTVRVMEKMDSSASNLDTKGLAQARKSINSASADMARFQSATSSAGQNGVNSLSNNLANLSGPAYHATGSVKTFFASFAGAAAAYISLQSLTEGFKKFIGTADEAVSTKARLDLMNDGLQTTKQLQDMIFQSAQRSRGVYQLTADSVSKLGMQASAAFSSNQDLINFSEQINKTFVIAGTSAEGVSSVMLQLTQAMAAGKLQGEELNAVLDNAQPIVQNIADYMKVPVGSIKKMASEGKITAAVIKNAMFAAADETNKKFESMPLTFGQAMNSMSNKTKVAFEPLFVRFNDFVNSDTFTTLSGQVMSFVTLSVAGLMILLDFMGYIYTAFNAVAEYWPVIAAGLAILIAVYFPVIIGYFNFMLIKLWLMLEPILAQAAAWAIAYWPITLVILAVIALIGILMYFGVTTEQILGFVGGLFYALGAVIWNIIAITWNAIATFAEFLVNVFIDPTYAVQKLFYDLAMSVINHMVAIGGSFDNVANALGQAFVNGANIAISAINGISAALNLIPGVEIGKIGKLSAGASSVVSNGLKSLAGNLKAPISSKDVVSISRMDLKSLPGAYKAGQTAGSNLKMPSFSTPKSSDNTAMPNLKAIPSNLLGADGGAKGKNPTGGKLDSIGKIDDDISISDEDLKLLKELADIRSIQNFVTLQPSVTFGDMNIREEADIDKLLSKINESLTNSMNESVEGAYA